MVAHVKDHHLRAHSAGACQEDMGGCANRDFPNSQQPDDCIQGHPCHLLGYPIAMSTPDSKWKPLFYLLMSMLILPPLFFVIYLFLVSAFTYDTLNHPERHADSNRIWVQIARLLYYTYEVHLWQSEKDCVNYDQEVLYVPSSGCNFFNTEFSTQLTFSSDGRTIDTNAKKTGPPVFVLGDSGTMGWGVNDSETYSYLIGLRISVPVFNLAVSSYGTAREMLRAIRHPRFADAKCILLQYHGNDFGENKVFLSPQGLPPPTPERFESLFSYKPRKLSLVEVTLRTWDFVWTYPIDFFSALMGKTTDWKVEELFSSVGKGTEAPDHAVLFLRVLQRFPELRGKTVFVVLPSWFGSALGAIPNLPANIIPLQIDPYATPRYYYSLDLHENKFGHRFIADEILSQMERHKIGRDCLHTN
jgi:hypothetical protein